MWSPTHRVGAGGRGRAVLLAALVGGLVVTPVSVSAGRKPVNTSLPTISGVPEQGQTFSPPTIAGTAAEARTLTAGEGYVVVADDVGATMRVAVTASNSAGSASATSAQTAASRRRPHPGVTSS